MEIKPAKGTTKSTKTGRHGQNGECPVALAAGERGEGIEEARNGRVYGPILTVIQIPPEARMASKRKLNEPKSCLGRT